MEDDEDVVSYRNKTRKSKVYNKDKSSTSNWDSIEPSELFYEDKLSSKLNITKKKLSSNEILLEQIYKKVIDYLCF